MDRAYNLGDIYVPVLTQRQRLFLRPLRAGVQMVRTFPRRDPSYVATGPAANISRQERCDRRKRRDGHLLCTGALASLTIARLASAIAFLHLRDVQPGRAVDPRLPAPSRDGHHLPDKIPPLRPPMRRRSDLRRVPQISPVRPMVLQTSLAQDGGRSVLSATLQPPLQPLGAADSCGARTERQTQEQRDNDQD